MRVRKRRKRETWDEIKQLAVICQHQHPCTEFHAWCFADRKYSMIGREPSTHSPHFFGEFWRKSDVKLLPSLRPLLACRGMRRNAAKNDGCTDATGQWPEANNLLLRDLACISYFMWSHVKSWEMYLFAKQLSMQNTWQAEHLASRTVEEEEVQISCNHIDIWALWNRLGGS